MAGLLTAGWTTSKGALVSLPQFALSRRVLCGRRVMFCECHVASFYSAPVWCTHKPALPSTLLAWHPHHALQVMPLMAQGFRMGLVKFVLITARKPQ
jgi:hypothetical protein